jgi:hypothetical protein
MACLRVRLKRLVDSQAIRLNGYSPAAKVTASGAWGRLSLVCRREAKSTMPFGRGFGGLWLAHALPRHNCVPGAIEQRPRAAGRAGTEARKVSATKNGVRAPASGAADVSLPTVCKEPTKCPPEVIGGSFHPTTGHLLPRSSLKALPKMAQEGRLGRGCAKRHIFGNARPGRAPRAGLRALRPQATAKSCPAIGGILEGGGMKEAKDRRSRAGMIADAQPSSITRSPATAR